MHEMRLNNGPFNLIKEGSKTVEMRLYDEKRKNIQVGDIIKFINRSTNEELKVKVTYLHIYDSFESLYRDFDKVSIGYKKDDEANPKDMEKYYSIEDQNKYGVLGIEMELYIDNSIN